MLLQVAKLKVKGRKMSVPITRDTKVLHVNLLRQYREYKFRQEFSFRDGPSRTAIFIRIDAISKREWTGKSARCGALTRARVKYFYKTVGSICLVRSLEEAK